MYIVKRSSVASTGRRLKLLKIVLIMQLKIRSYLGVIKYLYSNGTSKDKGIEATKWGIDWAAESGRVTSKTT
jgi:hypothetical protein